MKVAWTILTFSFLAGCSICQLKNPLDGKGHSWCERQKRAEHFCERVQEKPNYGVEWVVCGNYWRVTTKDYLEALESQCKVRDRWGQCVNVNKGGKSE